MGLLPSPLIASFYKESFEQQITSLAAKKLGHLYRYADGAFAA